MTATEQLSELQELLDAKTRLMQDVAHELKNPLCAIHGYASYLTKENVSPEVVRKSLKVVLSNAERLIVMVDHLQEAVRLESDRFFMEINPIEGATLLQEAVESVELEAARRDARLRWNSPVGDSLLVNADPRRVLQVLGNLLSNALKFTPAGGAIDCTARRDGEFVRFSVIDTGPGISAEDLPLIFDRFYQASNNLKKREGLGLGLAICKGLVTAHGGRIWVESLPGAGSAFSFTLPAVLTSICSPR